MPVVKSNSCLKQDNSQKYNPESEFLRFVSEDQLAKKSTRRTTRQSQHMQDYFRNSRAIPDSLPFVIPVEYERNDTHTYKAGVKSTHMHPP